MFKLIVNGKNGREESEFTKRSDAQDHFDLYRSKGHWGKGEQVIEHAEIPAVYETVIHPAEPALLDENGIEVVPAKPEWSEQVLISEAVPAWTETIPSQFTYEIVSVTPILEDISPRQIALALLSMGITESQVIASINQLPSPLKEQGVIAWNRSNYFVRTEPAVAMIGALMSLSNEQLDNIWKLGITL